MASIVLQDVREVSGGKGNTANFVWRCGTCKRESSAKFEDKSPTIPYSAEANSQFAPFLTIECRGLEFIGFDPRASSFGFIFPFQECLRTTRASGNVLVLSLGPCSLK